MLKVGIIGFGGGNALIPVIEEEAVHEKKLVTKEEYDKDVIAATLTPGALPVEIASGVGLQSCGKKGMVLGGTMMALPGALLTLLFLVILGQLNQRILTQVQYASIGITAVIMCLLTKYISDTLQIYKKSRWRIHLWIVMIGVFLATGGKTLLKIFGINGDGVLKLSTIHILLLTILGSIIFSLSKKRKKKKKMQQIEWKPLASRMVIWVLFFLILSVPAVLFSAKDLVIYDAKGLASSLMSFGGGDAYLTIADGLFVPDYISENEFYNHLVLIVNVLPGSILCKTLTGVGYEYGMTQIGVFGGLAFALAGFACSVAASCGIFHIVYYVGDWLEDINVFVVIRKAIRVVVSGLLLTVMASLIYSGMDMNANPNLPSLTVFFMIVALYAVNMFLYYKLKCKNRVLIIVSLLLSLVICNILHV